MSTSARSYLTAGIAAFSAGAIALTPVAPAGPDPGLLPQHVAELAVGLTAAVTPVDPIQNIIDIVTAAGDNLGTLVNDWATGLYVNGTFPFPPNTTLNGNLGWRTGGYASGAAFPITAQVVSNLITYFGELPDIGTIAGQVFGNISNALGAPFAVGVEESARALNIIPNSPYNQNVNAVPYITIPGLATVSQRDVWALLPTLAGDAYASLKPILDAASTPVSGLLVGAIGPIVAPALAVVSGLSNTFALLQESDFVGALTELINIPANTVGAFLNGGQVLDLTPLLSLAGITLPDSITSIGLQMGGLLSPGGVAFDALAADAEALGSPITISGLPVGPIGALTSLTNYVAKSIVVTPPTDAEAPAPAATVGGRDAATEDPEPAPAAATAEPAAPSTDVRARGAAADPETGTESETAKAQPRSVRSARVASAGSAAAANSPASERVGRSAAARTR